MQPRSMWRLRLLGMGAICAGVGASMAHAAPSRSDEASIDALYRCYRRGIDKAHDVQVPVPADPASSWAMPVPFGPGSELFFFEQLGAAMRVEGGAVRPRWCEAWFVAPYVRAHAALHASTSHEEHSSGLPLATGAHLAAESRLIHLAARMGGVSHVSAHAEMVRRAMAQPKLARQLGRLQLDACARGLLMQAAQMPDLYLFAATTWHARSQAAAANDTAASQALAEADRMAFVAEVVHAVQGARAALGAQDTEVAMLLLGAAAHAVQDLTFHRGMTLDEQAGLTYVAHANPDLPPDPAYPRAIAAATAATAEVLTRALAPLPSRAAKPIRPSLELAQEVAEVAHWVQRSFPSAQAASHAALRAYLALAGRYRGPDAPSLAAANLGRWPVPATLDAVLAGL